VFVDGLKNSGKWENTLLIVTADHGTVRPDNAPIYDTANFRIPLLLTGGVVDQDTSVYSVVSQMDIFPTIARLFDHSTSRVNPSLLTPQGRAFYSFHDGVVYVSDSTLNMWDIGMKAYIKPQEDKPYEKGFYQQQNKKFFKN
jgi:arylsulfatase A-like enzyme